MRGLAVVMVLASVTALAAPAAAQSRNETPPARIGILTAARQNLGAAGDAYGLGLLAGFQAGYQPPWLPVGALWSVLFGRFTAANGEIVDPDNSTVEMSLGLHARFRLSDEALRYLFVTGGGTILRTENTLPPDGERQFFGPYAGFGYEDYFFGRFLVGAELRYAFALGGPESLSFNLGLSFGTR